MKKLTGVKALAFSGIMASITILLILVSNVIIGLGIISILILPMCSTFISLKVDWKYRLVYFCACLITFIIDPSLTLFIVIPSLISGIVLGTLVSKYLQGYYQSPFQQISAPELPPAHGSWPASREKACHTEWPDYHKSSV